MMFDPEDYQGDYYHCQVPKIHLIHPVTRHKDSLEWRVKYIIWVQVMN
jgi:hypothetical protein